MKRAGREPAEDVKRRLMAVCQEVGLTVAQATLRLLPRGGNRLVYVGASLPGWQYECSTLSVMAIVPVNGEWPDVVDIRCCATEADPAQVLGPWMQGRDQVPFTDLIENLRATLAERELVIAAAKRGMPAPYTFDRSVWKRVDPVEDVG